MATLILFTQQNSAYGMKYNIMMNFKMENEHEYFAN